jgi:hypothetical protein
MRQPKILLEQDMQLALQQERARADRGGHEFSVLVFEHEKKQPAGALIEKLCRAIVSRVRMSDDFGWLSKDSIGVILPDTPFAGARRLADEIQNAAGSSKQFFYYKIYTYPPRGPSNEKYDLDGASMLMK